jgi:hypothetical protein
MAWVFAAFLVWFPHRAPFADVVHEIIINDARRVVPMNASHLEVRTDSPLLDAIMQNTRGCSEGYPLGVPRNYSWFGGSSKPNVGPPTAFTAVMGWGQIYPEIGTETNGTWSGKIEVARAQTWIRLKSTKQWMLAQVQSKAPLAGAYFVANFARNENIRMQTNRGPDDHMLIDSPPGGYNAHFWFASRGTFPAGAIDGVYVQMDMRTTEPKANLVANVGADWWRDVTADFAQGFTNNPGAGMSNWVKLSTEWSRLRFFSLDTAEFREMPPPPLAESSDPAVPSAVRRPLSVTPCPA